MTSTSNTTSSPGASDRALRRPLAAALSASAILVAAGCGSDDQERPAAAAGSSRAALRVTETDFAIKPARARVERPGAVRISVVNCGQTPHALAIETPDRVVQTDTLSVGESGDVEADLEAGTYAWFCPVDDHRARGMQGKITVGSGGSAGGGSEEDRPRSDDGY